VLTRFTKGRIIVRGKLVTHGQAAGRLHYLLQAEHPAGADRGQGQFPQLGDGMQQALDYATTFDIPFVFSSNGSAICAYSDEVGRGFRAKAAACTD
jgi:type I restriction enzyme, R subunit